MAATACSARRHNFAESGLVGELIVNIISIGIVLALLLMAIAPDWIRAAFKIKLEKGSVSGTAVVVLILVVIVATALGPEPPGGW